MLGGRGAFYMRGKRLLEYVCTRTYIYIYMYTRACKCISVFMYLYRVSQMMAQPGRPLMLEPHAHASKKSYVHACLITFVHTY